MAVPARSSAQGSRLARLQWVIGGQVQGVGFRPFVCRLARQYGLTGWVGNDRRGATIQAQGPRRRLRRFEAALISEAPPLCRISHIDQQLLAVADEHDFRIVSSDGSAQHIEAGDITVDTAVCNECLAELLSPHDRRHGYPLINCTQCGPRFTILRRTPYDRCNTTMHGFVMCAPCRREYTNPSDRRFHAQPIACHDCGPRVQLVDANGVTISDNPIATARSMLFDGKIIAVKGLGGFHLAVRADRAEAVRRMRSMKHRPAKPFAVMVRDFAHAQELVHVSAAGAALLASPQAPIVLAPRRTRSMICHDVAPANHRLGIMLPYTPLHHLLVRGDSFPPLIMTSANDGGEPLVIDNTEALSRLGGLCDALLWHDRPIERAVDDSIFIDLPAAAPIPVRRARGYVPAPLRLPTGGESHGLAVGGELKSTVAVVRDGKAIVGQHLGDLSHPDAILAFRRSLDDLTQLFDVRPAWIAHDLHPAYASTIHARQLAGERSLPLIAVQHHHAHAAALLAEHGLTGPALVIVCDGTGYGDDGTVWGGELLLADLCTYRRVAHLKPLRLPGGDASARDPRRCALAMLHLAFGDSYASMLWIDRLEFDSGEAALLTEMIRTSVGCAQSSGAGRLFDAVSAILGICRENRFEAQAAMALESSAELFGTVQCHGAPFDLDADGAIDLSPMLRDLVARRETGVAPEQLAAEFHEQFARVWATVAAECARDTGIRTVGLSGGVFCNGRLTQRLGELLRQRGLTVTRHEVIPPNDGGIAFGQAAVASARIANDATGKAGA